MRLVICEDNGIEQEKAARIVKMWAKKRKVDIDLLNYSNAEEFLFAWPDIVVDIIFLDIKMKEISGIQLAEKIRQEDKKVLIVFVTNYKQYSLEGYDVDAFHFLVKPISVEKMINVLDKAHDIWYSSEKDSIVVPSESGQKKIFCGDIYYIKMNSHIAEIHTEKEVFRVRTTIKELTKNISSYFIRCHRSYIINLMKPVYVCKDHVLFSTGVRLPISKSKSKVVNDTFVRMIKE